MEPKNLTPEQLTAYQVRPGETTDAYNARVGAYNASTPDEPDVTGDPFMREIQSRLLRDTGGTSSINPVASMIESSIRDIRSGMKRSAEGIEAKYEQDRQRMAYDFDRQLTGAREGAYGLGPASQVAVLEQYREANSRRLNDLNLAERQALATGQYEAATRIADLKLRAAESQFDFEQKTFGNLFQAANLYMQQQQERRLAEAEQYDRRAAMGNIALQYGIKLNPGDTIESVIERAMPMASEKQRLELAQIRAQIAASNRSGAGGNTQQDRFSALTGSIASALERSKQYHGGKAFHSDEYKKQLTRFVGSGMGTESDFHELFKWGLDDIDKALFTEDF